MSPPGSASTCRPVTPIHQAYNACRMFRKFRILLLLLVLATVALSAWRANARLTSWEHSVHIALYPVAADDSPTTARYVAQLGADDFAEIGEWLRPTDSAAGKRHAVHAPSFELGERVFFTRGDVVPSGIRTPVHKGVDHVVVQHRMTTGLGQNLVVSHHESN